MDGQPESISADSRRRIRRALRSCQRVRLDSRTMMAPEEIRDAKLLVVEQGVALLTACPAGAVRPAVLTLAGPGSVLPPPASGECLVGLGDAVVTAVSPPAYEALLSDPRIARVVVDALLNALLERQESLANVTRGLHAERLRAKLVQLAREYGKVAPDGIHIPLPLTHELLARMVGSARETVTITLAQLQREGFLTRDERGYKLSVSADTLATRQS